MASVIEEKLVVQTICEILSDSNLIPKQDIKVTQNTDRLLAKYAMFPLVYLFVSLKKHMHSMSVKCCIVCLSSYLGLLVLLRI